MFSNNLSEYHIFLALIDLPVRTRNHRQGHEPLPRRQTILAQLRRPGSPLAPRTPSRARAAHDHDVPHDQNHEFVRHNRREFCRMVPLSVGSNTRHPERYYTAGVVFGGGGGAGGAMRTVSYTLFGAFSRGGSVSFRPENQHRELDQVFADVEVYVS